MVLKATAGHLRNRPDLAHVWRNIANAEEMQTAWESLERADRRRRATPASWCRRSPRPGVPVAIGAVEDPLFGPVTSFGISGPLTDLLGDKAYRIPPLTEHDARAMTREIKSSPMLFGYRGSEVVDVDRIEELIVMVSRLKNDFPQLRSLELPLVLAGRETATVLTAEARVEPVADPRSDWFVRRLNQDPDDTMQD